MLVMILCSIVVLIQNGLVELQWQNQGLFPHLDNAILLPSEDLLREFALVGVGLLASVSHLLKFVYVGVVRGGSGLLVVDFLYPHFVCVLLLHALIFLFSFLFYLPNRVCFLRLVYFVMFLSIRERTLNSRILRVSVLLRAIHVWEDFSGLTTHLLLRFHF